jgi:hypothetical protein
MIMRAAAFLLVSSGVGRFPAPAPSYATKSARIADYALVADSGNAAFGERRISVLRFVALWAGAAE